MNPDQIFRVDRLWTDRLDFEQCRPREREPGKTNYVRQYPLTQSNQTGGKVTRLWREVFHDPQGSTAEPTSAGLLSRCRTNTFSPVLFYLRCVFTVNY